MPEKYVTWTSAKNVLLRSIVESTLSTMLSEDAPTLNSKVDSCVNQLKDHYQEPNRFYHNLSHVLSVLDYTKVFCEMMNELDLIGPDLIYAALYHDVIYDTKRSDNEELSALYAVKQFGTFGCYETQRAATITELILSTKHVSVPSNIGCQVLCDADLASLGMGWDICSMDAGAIEQEYVLGGHYNLIDFRRGRYKWIHSMLAHEHIYITQHARELLEARARQNLAHQANEIEMYFNEIGIKL